MRINCQVCSSLTHASPFLKLLATLNRNGITIDPSGRMYPHFPLSVQFSAHRTAATPSEKSLPSSYDSGLIAHSPLAFIYPVFGIPGVRRAAESGVASAIPSEKLDARRALNGLQISRPLVSIHVTFRRRNSPYSSPNGTHGFLVVTRANPSLKGSAAKYLGGMTNLPEAST